MLLTLSYVLVPELRSHVLLTFNYATYIYLLFLPMLLMLHVDYFLCKHSLQLLLSGMWKCLHQASIDYHGHAERHKGSDNPRQWAQILEESGS